MSPELSIIVISYNIARELPRTLFSLSAAYQRGIERESYEVLVVDNGSPVPPEAADYADLDVHLRFFRMQPPHPSPVAAVNFGVAQSQGKYVCVYIDGARLASPGLLATAMQALRLSPRAVVGSRGRYLGPDFQSAAMRRGYTREREDRLLDEVGWRDDGYKLFSISVFDESSFATWFQPVAESNSLFLPRAMWDELGGYDPCFARAGGGMANLDAWRRALLLPGAVAILLLGEATFHQLHGGSSTNHPEPLERGSLLAEEYRQLRGMPYQIPPVLLRFWGAFHFQPPRSEMLGGWWSPLVRRMHYEYLRYRWKRLLGKLRRGRHPQGPTLPPPW